jgi:hypothetical protein
MFNECIGLLSSKTHVYELSEASLSALACCRQLKIDLTDDGTFQEVQKALKRVSSSAKWRPPRRLLP